MGYKCAVFVTCLILRLCCLISQNSFYVADEYWQSLEVAHRLVFGYGYLTWEWIEGIRSYLYVAWIALIYQILKLLYLDYVDCLIWIPLIIQAIFSTISDWYFISWTYNISVGSQAYWSSWLYMTNVFLAYCSTRTLTNTIELNLTCISLYYYPMTKRQCATDTTKYFWFVCLACVVRPTAAVVWAPLCFFAICDSLHPLRLLFKAYVPVGLKVLTISTIFDSLFHGELVFTWWNFFKFNIIQKINASYSTHSFFWYWTIGLPVVLGPCIVPFYLTMSTKFQIGVWNTIRFDKMFTSITFSLIAFSLIPHKEFRFLLPLCPLMIHFAAYRMYDWTYWMGKKQKSLIAFLLLFTSAPIFYFLSRYHQVGTVKVMDYLRSPNNNLLFLMPCHLTPMYSHLHMNISTRFLHCEPNLANNVKYIEESVQFYHHPIAWLEKEYPKMYAETNPTHIICFDVLVPSIEKFLLSRGYEKQIELYHGTFVPPKVGNYLLVFQRSKIT